MRTDRLPGAFSGQIAWKQVHGKSRRGPDGLVVEDDILVRADIAEFLRQKGWSVLETAIGAARCD
jgi:hypothetical protein